VEPENFVPHHEARDISSSVKYICKHATIAIEAPSSVKYKLKLTVSAGPFCIPWTSLWKLKILSVGFLCQNWKFCPTSSGKGRFRLYKIQMQACSHWLPKLGGKEAETVLNVKSS